jgi:hypothetical protein
MKDAGPGGPTGHPGYLRKRARVKEDLRGSSFFHSPDLR